MRSQQLGRFIGATGAGCASLLWTVVVLGAIAAFLEPKFIDVIIAIPVGALAVVLLVVSVWDVAVLVQRAEIELPWRVGVMHVAMAIFVLYFVGSVLIGGALLAIAATQMIAIRLIQVTPSQR
jgi:hypothetical protein